MRVHFKVGYEQCRSQIGFRVLLAKCIKGRFDHKHHEGWTDKGEFVVWHCEDHPCSTCCPITSEKETNEEAQ